MTQPFLALALSGPHLVELASSPALLSRWDELPVAFSILGIDRIDGSARAAATLASSAVGATLAGATTKGRFFITAAAHRDHPYNLARRVASLGHLSRGRSGLLIGVRDAYAPEGPKDAPAWGGAALGAGAPLNVQTAYDAARAIRALEQSWPHESIIGDRETGILVQSDRIAHVDIEHSFSIAGPLNAPEPATGASVIAWYASTNVDVPPGHGRNPIDLVIGEAGSIPVVHLGQEPPSSRVSGVVLRAGLRHSVSELLDAAEGWLSTSFAPTRPGGPLRAALDLAPPEPRPSTVRAAFPLPQPQALA